MVWVFWKKAKYPAPAVELTTVLWSLKPKPCYSTDYRVIYLHATFHLPKHTIFTQMQDEVFPPLNLVLIYMVSS